MDRDAWAYPIYASVRLKSDDDLHWRSGNGGWVTVDFRTDGAVVTLTDVRMHPDSGSKPGSGRFTLDATLAAQDSNDGIVPWPLPYTPFASQ